MKKVTFFKFWIKKIWYINKIHPRTFIFCIIHTLHIRYIYIYFFLYKLDIVGLYTKVYIFWKIKNSLTFRLGTTQIQKKKSKKKKERKKFFSFSFLFFFFRKLKIQFNFIQTTCTRNIFPIFLFLWIFQMEYKYVYETNRWTRSTC